MTPPWFVFAGGGTGGHLFPALSVIDRLRARVPDARVTFFCTRRALDGQILGPTGAETRPLDVIPFTFRPWHWPRFWSRWRRSVRQCEEAFRHHDPTCVVGAGGYASGPPVQAALQLGVPTFLLNPDAVPGRANRHFARHPRLTAILAQWAVTERHVPATAPVIVTGCPVRDTFRPRSPTEVAEIRRSFGLAAECPTLLVTGASQGARTINEAMMRLAAVVRDAGWQALHLSGPADEARVRQAYADAGTPAIVQAFTDHMGEAMAAADLIVSRAGASTLAEVLAVGRPSVLLPYPYHRDQHQAHNAQVLVDAGAAVTLRDRKDATGNARALGPVLTELMADMSRRTQMADAAAQLGRPDAAGVIAGRLLEPLLENGAAASEFSSHDPAVRLSRRMA